jgi:hypothetical protein
MCRVVLSLVSAVYLRMRELSARIMAEGVVSDGRVTEAGLGEAELACTSSARPLGVDMMGYQNMCSFILFNCWTMNCEGRT